MWGHKKENNHWIHNNILLETNIDENMSHNMIIILEKVTLLTYKWK